MTCAGMTRELGLHRSSIYAAAASLLRPQLGECTSYGEHAGPGTRAGRRRFSSLSRRESPVGLLRWGGGG